MLDDVGHSDDRFSIFLRQTDEKRSLERRMRKRFIFYDEEKQLAMIKDLCRLRERRDNGSTNIEEDQQVCQTENDIFMNTDRHFDLRHFSSLPLLPTKIENDCEGFKYGKRHGIKLVTPVTFDDVREWRTLTTAKGNNRC